VLTSSTTDGDGVLLLTYQPADARAEGQDTSAAR
jgi:hypothetical protein